MRVEGAKGFDAPVIAGALELVASGITTAPVNRTQRQVLSLSRAGVPSAAVSNAGRTRRPHRALKGSNDQSGSFPKVAEWLNPQMGSFDDFGSTMLLLYVVSSGDGWDRPMWRGMDAVEEGVAPQRNDFSLVSLFFIAWM